MKGSEFDDYRMYMTTEGRSAVLVSQIYTVSVKWDSTLQFPHYKWCSAVIIGDTGAVAAYFAHSGLPESFLEGMFECRSILNHMKSLGCEKFVIGTDLNSQLPSEILNCTGTNCFHEPDQDHFERCNTMIRLLDDFDMFAANTSDYDNEPQFTRKVWRKDQQNEPRFYQIDFICLGNVFRSSLITTFNEKAVWRSDHYPVRAILDKVHKLKSWKSRVSYAGWKLKGDDRETFGSRFVDKMEVDVIKESFTIEQFQSCVEETADSFPYQTRSTEIRQMKAAPEEVRKARLERRSTEPGTIERKTANQKVRTVGKAWKATSAVSNGKKMKARSLCRQLHCRETDKMETDPEMWKEEIREHCTTKYFTADFDDAKTDDIIGELRKEGEEMDAAGSRTPDITISHFFWNEAAGLRARARPLFRFRS